MESCLQYTVERVLILILAPFRVLCSTITHHRAAPPLLDKDKSDRLLRVRKQLRPTCALAPVSGALALFLPLVSTSLSLGSASTGSTCTTPSLATIVLSAPCVNTTMRARVPDAFGRAGTSFPQEFQFKNQFLYRRDGTEIKMGEKVRVS